MLKSTGTVLVVLIWLVSFLFISGANVVMKGRAPYVSGDKCVYVLIDLSASAQQMDKSGNVRLSILGDVLRYLVMYQALVPRGRMCVKVLEYTSAFFDGYKEVEAQDLVLSQSLLDSFLGNSISQERQVPLSKVTESSDILNIFKIIYNDIGAQEAGKVEDLKKVAQFVRQDSINHPNSLVVLISQVIVNPSSGEEKGEEPLICLDTRDCLGKAIDEWEKGTAKRPWVVAFLFSSQDYSNYKSYKTNWDKAFKSKGIGTVTDVTLDVSGKPNSKIIWEGMTGAFKQLGWIDDKVNNNSVYYQEVKERLLWNKQGKLGILVWKGKEELPFTDKGEGKHLLFEGVKIEGFVLGHHSQTAPLVGNGDVWVGKFAPQSKGEMFVKADGEIFFVPNIQIITPTKVPTKASTMRPAEASAKTPTVVMSPSPLPNIPKSGGNPPNEGNSNLLKYWHGIPILIDWWRWIGVVVGILLTYATIIWRGDLRLSVWGSGIGTFAGAIEVFLGGVLIKGHSEDLSNLFQYVVVMVSVGALAVVLVKGDKDKDKDKDKDTWLHWLLKLRDDSSFGPGLGVFLFALGWVVALYTLYTLQGYPTRDLIVLLIVVICGGVGSFVAK